MNIYYTTGIIILSLAGILIAGVIFFSFLKYIKKHYYPNWKFPDYISVGYAEYLYYKFIKRGQDH
ncbi:hypothetical protein [Mucilaginibacter glaciei]|uniref:Uncharacterized protein n=1 Tax=Mucilaginibacter glaciei TaxID=2772109 RepID=A0A926NPU6_9SPHI|nr:hypothetical protein [Mucilaginibacter glaciei]MBD1393183.1 hypothetical protein [Mucilaginibacter glaciei]